MIEKIETPNMLPLQQEQRTNKDQNQGQKSNDTTGNSSVAKEVQSPFETQSNSQDTGGSRQQGNPSQQDRPATSNQGTGTESQVLPAPAKLAAYTKQIAKLGGQIKAKESEILVANEEEAEKLRAEVVRLKTQLSEVKAKTKINLKA